MSQTTVNFAGDPTGVELMDDLLAPLQDNLLTQHSGTSRPSYAQAGTLWLDTVTTPWVLKLFDGTNDIIIGSVSSSDLKYRLPLGVPTPLYIPAAGVGGTANVVTLTTGFSNTAYYVGMLIVWMATADNTGAVTVNVDSLGAKDLQKRGSTALGANDLQTGRMNMAVYDGTRFQLVSRGLIKSGDIDAGQVLTAAIANGNVTYAKMASAAIASTAEIVAGTASKIVDAAGLVALYKSCSLYKAAAQSLPPNTIQACVFDTEYFDDSGWHSNSTNNTRITVDFTGRVRFNAECYFVPTAACVLRLYLYKNGSQIGTNIADQVLSGSTNVTLHLDHTVECTSGDYFEIMAFQNSGAAANITAYVEAERRK